MQQQSPVEIGEILADKFRVERVLGIGGMGVVVAATHLHLDKLVALKFMLQTASENQEGAARFLREAKAAARLRNQHIAKVMDVGTLENGAPYMVMEYLEGMDLEEHLEDRMKTNRGPLPSIEAVDYIMQACLGMAEAHSIGFVHRDLKPPNLFLTTGPDGQPLIKVLDFGIAKANMDGIATKTQAVMGSPFYMSPEQWQGVRNVDERGDIWALGAILHYLLTGAPPFEAESIPTLYAQIATELPAAIPGIPQGLQQAISFCMEKKAEDRPQNVAELAARLMPFAGHRGAEYAQKAADLMGASVSPDSVSGSETKRTLAGVRAPSTGSQPPGYSTGIHSQSSSRFQTEPPLSQSSQRGTGDSQPFGYTGDYTPQRSKWIPVVGLGILLTAGIVTIAVVSGGSSEPAATLKPATENAGVVPTDTQAAVPTPIPQGTLDLITVPSGAVVLVNGALKGTTPLTLTLDVGREIDLEFSLAGYDKLTSKTRVKTQDSLTFPLAKTVVPEVAPPKLPAVEARTEVAEIKRNKKRKRAKPRQAKPKKQDVRTNTENSRSSKDRRH